jgi:hypothetical protein
MTTESTGTSMEIKRALRKNGKFVGTLFFFQKEKTVLKEKWV